MNLSLSNHFGCNKIIKLIFPSHFNMSIPIMLKHYNTLGKGKTKEERKQLLAERKPPIILMTYYAHEGLFILKSGC